MLHQERGSVEKEIIVDINPYQTRVVLLEDGSPSEIYIERRGRERLVGLSLIHI